MHAPEGLSTVAFLMSQPMAGAPPAGDTGSAPRETSSPWLTCALTTCALTTCSHPRLPPQTMLHGASKLASHPSKG